MNNGYDRNERERTNEMAQWWFEQKEELTYFFSVSTFVVKSFIDGSAHCEQEYQPRVRKDSFKAIRVVCQSGLVWNFRTYKTPLTFLFLFTFSKINLTDLGGLFSKHTFLYIKSLLETSRRAVKDSICRDFD